MKVSSEAIKEFQALYEEHYGEKLTEAQAREMGTELLELYSLVMGRSINEPI